MKLINVFLLAWLMSFISSASEINILEPYVLIHGCLGFGGELPFKKTYWGDVPEFLQSKGFTVFVAHVSAVHDSEKRAEQLHEQLKAWGHEKYNLVGHSQGGLDACLLLEKYPRIVASVATINAPHHGSPLADFIYQKIESLPAILNTVWKIGDVLGYCIDIFSRHYIDSVLVSQQLATQFLDLKNEIWANINTPLALQAINKFCQLGINDFLNNARQGIKKASIMACDAGSYACEVMHEVYERALEQDARKAIECLTTQGSEKRNSNFFPTGIKLYSWGTYEVSATSKWDLLGKCMQLSSWWFFGNKKNDGVVSLESMKFGHWLGELAGPHHLLAAQNGLGYFCQEHADWMREMFLTLSKHIEQNGRERQCK